MTKIYGKQSRKEVFESSETLQYRELESGV